MRYLIISFIVLNITFQLSYLNANEISGKKNDTVCDYIRTRYSGYISFRALTSDALADTSTIGENAFSNTVNHQGRFSAVLKTGIKIMDYKFATQVRPRLYLSSRKKADQVAFDEFYVEKELLPTAFLLLGRKKTANGAALGYNPTDFLNELKTQNNTLPDTERRTERKGNDQIAYSHYLDGFSILLLAARKIQNGQNNPLVMQVNGRIDKIKADYVSTLYYGDRPGWGLEVSATLNDAWVGFAEYTLRRGRDRLTPSYLSHGNVVLLEDSSRSFEGVVIGSRYTMRSGVNVNFEYWYNENAYTETEIQNLWSAIDTGQSDTATIREAISTPYMRRSKIFFRISEIPILSEKIFYEQTVLFGLSDYSCFSRSSIDWVLSPKDNLRVAIDHSFGSDRSEYDLNSFNRRILFSYKRLF